MSTVVEQNLAMRASGSVSDVISTTAANDDHLPSTSRSELDANFSVRQESVHHETETTTGWNAYDVWRRLIKEARDRRETASKSSR